MRIRPYLRLAALALGFLVLAWLLPNLLSAERYRHRVQARLEQALGRHVSFGSISFKLIPHPGFSLRNVVIHENPAFGEEPFARADQIDCDLVWTDLLRARIAIARLGLSGATITLVRDERGWWNLEPPLESAALRAASSNPAPPLTIEVAGGRLNFKLGSVTTPFAVTGVEGRVSLDRARAAVAFQLSGSPLRTDLNLPSPGTIELSGRLSLLPRSPGALEATLSTRGALLYDWIPLAAARNPEIYGLLDADVHLKGTLQLLSVTARARVSQLRRWETLPPSGDMPVTLTASAQFDRRTGTATLDQAEASFAQSHVNLAGTVAGLGSLPVFDLRATSAKSRCEDVLGLAGRLAGWPRAEGRWGLTGALDASLAVTGSWPAPQLDGSLTARGGTLAIRAASFPISDAEVQFEGRRARLTAVRIEATPGLALLAEGELDLPAAPAEHRARGKSRPSRRTHPDEVPGYRLTISAPSASAHDVLVFARSAGFDVPRGLDARGMTAVSVMLSHPGWPLGRPLISAQASVNDTRVLVPGLARAIEIGSARLELNGDHFTADPVSLSFGGALFSGRIEHAGGRTQPWTFQGKSSALNLAEAATWLEAIGRPPELPWFAHIPGLATLAERRAAGSDLLNAASVSGTFETPAITYGRMTLRDFGAHLEVKRRAMRVTAAQFRVSTGRGRSEGLVDLTGPAPRFAADFEVDGLRTENWSSHLPPQLADARGAAALSGHFAAQGGSRLQIQSSLSGRLRVRVTNLTLGRFDPAQSAAHAAGWGELAPGRAPQSLRSVDLLLELQDRQMLLRPARFDLAGAVFEVGGRLGLDHTAHFDINVNLERMNRRWLDGRGPGGARVANFVLTGPLNALIVSPASPTVALQ